MSEFIELDSGVSVPAATVGKMLQAHKEGRLSDAMEQLISVSRLLEDATDRFISGASGGHQIIGMPPGNKLPMLNRLRRLRHTNPLAKHAAKLVCRYTFGAGVTWRAADQERVQPIIEAFWKDIDNQLELTTHQAMVARCDELWTDGELFFGMFAGKDGHIKVRSIPPEEIVDVITDPEDQRKPLYYRRQRQPRKYNLSAGTWEPDAKKGAVTYIPSWLNLNVEQDKVDKKWFNQNATTRAMLDDSMRIYHVAINKVGHFGLSELWTIRDWIRQFLQFMEDRVTINRAAAAIAWQRKVKGTSQDMTAAISKGIASKTVNIGETSVRIPPVSGSILSTPENVSYQWTRGDTGATQAVEDARMILMALGAGVSLPIHWFGEGGDANLATARAMNFPVFRGFLEWQQLWNSTLSFFHTYSLWKAIEAGALKGGKYQDTVGDDGRIIDRTYSYGEVNPFIDVDFPPLVQEDMKAMVEAVSMVMDKFGTTGEATKDLAALALTAIGANNIDEMITRWYPEGEEIPAAPALINAQAQVSRAVNAMRDLGNVIGGNGAKREVV